MTRLWVDIETYSSLTLPEVGVYAYSASPDFRILLFGYAYDDEPVRVIDLASGETLPAKLVQDIKSPHVTKMAHNAQFERVCLSAHLRTMLEPESWYCTAAHAAMLGLPLKLAQVTRLVLPLEHQKSGAGTALIKYFCGPCVGTARNSWRTRNLPAHAPAEWAAFKAYCGQDVVAERELERALAWYAVPAFERRLYALDQRINDRGVLLDPELVFAAIKCDNLHKDQLMQEALELAGITNAKSATQVKAWLNVLAGEDEQVVSLSKETMPALLKGADNATTRRVLEIRQELAKTSVIKYQAMARAQGPDNRVRGMLQYYGANRTGRWCLTGDHEILTPDGWVSLDSWGGGFIACWSKINEAISFQKAAAQTFDYEGDLLSIESQRCSQLSTPEHRMAVWSENGWLEGTVEQIFLKRPAIPFTGVRDGVGHLDSDPLRVLIMTQADGHYTAEGDLRFHFSKNRKIERCKTLLRRSGICFTYAGYARASVITIRNRDLPFWLRQFRDKQFGWWMLDESADVVFDELEHWDAYRCGPNSIQYSTTNKINADIIQALAHTSGRSGTLITKERPNPKWNTAYILNIWLTPGNRNEIRQKPNRTTYKGLVYCPATSTGFFLVRRNGRVWITGNSGRLVQLHNLPQNHMKDLGLCRTMVKRGDFDGVETLFGSISQALSELIRTAFIPKPGARFVVADFSAIEARVIAWWAGEQWRMDVFRTHGKIYEASAAAMFKVPIATITKGHPLRQRCKIAELALGFGGSVGALEKMGAVKMGVPANELKLLVNAWRAANPKIVQLWADVEEAALEAVNTGSQQRVGPVTFELGPNNTLLITLPSGRQLAYQNIRIEIDTRWNKPTLFYDGTLSESKGWGKVTTYGGKLTENVVQAIARDCLAEALVRLDNAGYRIVMHVHDEAVLEVPRDQAAAVDRACDIMGQTLSWAPDLPLCAAGFECEFYQKD